MRAYLQVSSVIFTLIALGHVVRVARRWPLLIAGRPLPALVSLVVVGVAGAMAVWGWRLLSTRRNSIETRTQAPPG
jgi:hypothetical protein